MPGKYRGPAITDWFQAACAVYAPLAGIPLGKLSIAYSDFAGVSGTSGDHQTTATGGTATKVAADSLYQLATGAVINQAAGVTIGGFTILNPLTTRWFMAAITQITSATDANSEIATVCLDGGSGDRVTLMVNNGQLVLRLIKGATPTDLITSWAVDTTLRHEFAVTFDLTTVRAFVDGVQVGSQTTLTNMPISEAQLHVQVKDGATATSRTANAYAFIVGRPNGL